MSEWTSVEERLPNERLPEDDPPLCAVLLNQWRGKYQVRALAEYLGQDHGADRWRIVHRCGTYTIPVAVMYYIVLPPRPMSNPIESREE